MVTFSAVGGQFAARVHRLCTLVGVALLGCALAAPASAHPLGNFTINHFVRVQIARDVINLRYVVDMAEIPTFQELQLADSDANAQTSAAELDAYLSAAAVQYRGGIILHLDGQPLPVHHRSGHIETPPGAGGLRTLRLENDFEAALPHDGTQPHTLRIENTNFPDRIGWHELIVEGAAGVTIFDSTAFGSAITDELRAYPDDLLARPLDERSAQLSFTTGLVPPGAQPLRTRTGAVAARRDRLAELIAVAELTPSVALMGLLLAAALGGLHALSPGHGKTVVGAYLVGSRGTARHALFLGVTVTITHTLGVFALGLATLFASEYVLPERLLPILTFISGAMVLAIGLRLFINRIRVLLPTRHHHEHDHGHDHGHHHHGDGEHDHHGHDHVHDHSHPHEHSHHHGELVHSHGGSTHSHLPPGADGTPITWRSLLALGVSGGIVPCPSALVVLLAAVALHRIGYGLLLILSFSVGLAAVLTAVGISFVYAGRLIKPSPRFQWLAQVFPTVSALVVSLAGAALCAEALAQASAQVTPALPAAVQSSFMAALPILGLGLVFGVKHALDADHVAAISTIVSEHTSLLRSSLVGGLWGIGHTISLLLAGLVVIVLHVEIGETAALALELCVAIMLIGLGANALRVLWRGGRVHLHSHQHGDRIHLHPHLHHEGAEVDGHSHHRFRFSPRPLVVGMVHGLAGSAALMLLVLSTIPSPTVGLAYIALFGLGSIGGMMAMSALLGVPVRMTAHRFAGAHATVRTLAALFSLSVGLYMAYEIGVVHGLLV